MWLKHIPFTKIESHHTRLNRITQFIPADHHTNLYHTLFESYPSYGVSVWGGAKPSKLKPVFKAQKKLYEFYLVIGKST